jgi:hypothetical protein
MLRRATFLTMGRRLGVVNYYVQLPCNSTRQEGNDTYKLQAVQKANDPRDTTALSLEVGAASHKGNKPVSKNWLQACIAATDIR